MYFSSTSFFLYSLNSYSQTHKNNHRTNNSWKIFQKIFFPSQFPFCYVRGSRTRYTREKKIHQKCLNKQTTFALYIFFHFLLLGKFLSVFFSTEFRKKNPATKYWQWNFMLLCVVIWKSVNEPENVRRVWTKWWYFYYCWPNICNFFFFVLLLFCWTVIKLQTFRWRTQRA